MTEPSTPETQQPTGGVTHADIERAAAVLRTGGLVALPTETVYGLGADARNMDAVQRIFAAKGRPANHPLIVHIASAEALTAWCAEVPAAAWLLAAAFWPGPMTMILRRDARVLDVVTGGQDTVGLRVPAHPVALQLLHVFGDGIAAPSANRFGHVSPTTAAHVRAELGSDVDMILDGGACTIGIESTIVDLTAARPRILRPGGVSRAQIEAVLGLEPAANTSDRVDAPRVSGTLASHYAPHTPVRWLDSAQLNEVIVSLASHDRVGVLTLGDAVMKASVTGDGAVVHWRALPTDPGAYAQQLYAQLRDIDALKLDLILLEVPPDTPPWEAVRDRLRRAAGLG